MGIFNSKRSRMHAIPELSSTSSSNGINNQTTNVPEPYKLVNMPDKYDDEVLNKLRRQLNTDASKFILNNLLLSVQFFANYEKEISDLHISNVSKKENQINDNLNDQQKHCLMPDTLHELIDRNVRYQSQHGTRKYFTEPLHTQRIIIGYDNVEVHNQSETSEYSSPLAGPIYRCVMESAQLNGFVEIKLKQIEVKSKQTVSPRPELIRHFSFSDCSRADHRLQNNDDDVIAMKLKKNIKSAVERRINHVHLKGDDDVVRRASLPLTIFTQTHNDELYNYSRITEHYTMKPLPKIKFSNDVDASTNLPQNCITTVQVQRLDDQLYDTDKKYTNLHEYQRYLLSQKNIELFDKMAYLNSIAFKNYFADIFITHIADALGFDNKSIETAMMQDTQIYIDKIENGNVINYVVIPAFTSSWPDDAYEWSTRARPIVQDVRTQTAYRWPTQGMINRIKEVPCHIYPSGFTPKHGTNPDNDLQWRLSFPAAERYLESHLFHAQIRCYLFTLLIYKTFLEPANESRLGLNCDHIRTHLFWECERNYIHWPEIRLGEKFRIFLQHLCQRLAHQHLPDYFIPSRNLFENVPSKTLAAVQYKIVQILENPVMYMIRALKNVKYMYKKFYPIFNYNQLYAILTTNDIISLLNPHLAATTSSNSNSTQDDCDEAYDSADSDINQDIVTLWYREAHRRIQREKMQQQQMAAEQVANQRKNSIESINIEIMPVKILDEIRRILLLKLFISHFIEMAKCSNMFDAIEQGLLYTEHAKNLTILLSEMTSGREDADEFFGQLHKIEKLLHVSSLTNEQQAPDIPARNIQLYSNKTVRKKSVSVSDKNTTDYYVNVGVNKCFKLVVPQSNESSTDDEIKRCSDIGTKTFLIQADIHKSHRPQSLQLNSCYTDESTDL